MKTPQPPVVMHSNTKQKSRAGYAYDDAFLVALADICIDIFIETQKTLILKQRRRRNI